MTTAPKSTLHIIADTRDGQAVADSLTREMRLRGFTVTVTDGESDVVIAVIAPGANPRTLFSGIDRQQTPIIVVAVGSLAPNFPGSEYSAVTLIRHDTGVPGRTPTLVIDALNELPTRKAPITPDPSVTTPPPDDVSPPIIPHDIPVTVNTFPPPRTKSLLEHLIFPLIVTVVGTVIAAYILGQTGNTSPPAPTATNTLSPTETAPINIEPLLTETAVPTISPIPPTNTVVTPTLTPVPPTPAPVTDGSPLTIFVTSDTLTIYAADTSAIDGLRFVDNNGESHVLGVYRSLQGIQFALVTPPLCIVLRQSNATSPLPQDCANAPNNNRFIQLLTAADVFWYDAISSTLPFEAFMGTQRLGQCPPAASECTLTLPDQ